MNFLTIGLLKFSSAFIKFLIAILVSTKGHAGPRFLLKQLCRAEKKLGGGQAGPEIWARLPSLFSIIKLENSQIENIPMGIIHGLFSFIPGNLTTQVILVFLDKITLPPALSPLPRDSRVPLLSSLDF